MRTVHLHADDVLSVVFHDGNLAQVITCHVTDGKYEVRKHGADVKIRA